MQFANSAALVSILYTVHDFIFVAKLYFPTDFWRIKITG